MQTSDIMFSMKDIIKKQFKKNGVYSTVPEADLVLDNLILFLRNKSELNKKVFTDKEMAHLQDVKVLINKVIVFLYILITLEIFFICLPS